MNRGALGREAIRPGVEEPLISIGEAPLDRMPALNLIFEEAVADFGRSLESLSQMPTSVTLEQLDARRVSDLDAEFAGDWTMLVYLAAGLDCKIAVVVDGGLRDIAVEVLLGSTIIEPPNSDRVATNAEMRLVERLLEKFLQGLGGAFRPIVDIEFSHDTSGAEASLTAVAQKAAVAIVGRCQLRAIDRDGSIVLMFPRAALDPFHVALSQFPGTDGGAQDERWSENLYDHIVRTEVMVEVKIEARGFTLGDIARLEVGDVLRLPIAPSSPIRVESEGRTLFWCTLGQKDGHYTVRLEDFSDERQSFIENVLGV